MRKGYFIILLCLSVLGMLIWFTCNLQTAQSSYSTISADVLDSSDFVRASSCTVYLIGDSTVSNYDSSLYPRMGWGQKLQSYFNSANVKISNKAISGRSSKSFYDEGAWTPVKNALQSGDFVLIQFGHNDEKSGDSARYTDPYTSFQQYLTKYIDEAKAKGASPVLVTPVHRNKWSGSSISDSHGNYPPAMRDLASKKGVPLIDLHKKSKTLFESLGQDYVTNKIFMNLKAGEYSNYPSGNTDNTHFQENGADKLCGLIRNGINELNLSIKGYLIK
jgi:lysophospholipase L1-like esterase